MSEKVEELENLRTWLATIKLGDVTPTLKVNGPQHPTALISVDVGQPLKQVRLTSEQVLELGTRLKKAAREMVDGNHQFRVTADNTHGIHWVGLA